MESSCQFWDRRRLWELGSVCIPLLQMSWHNFKLHQCFQLTQAFCKTVAKIILAPIFQHGLTLYCLHLGRSKTFLSDTFMTRVVQFPSLVVVRLSFYHFCFVTKNHKSASLRRKSKQTFSSHTQRTLYHWNVGLHKNSMKMPAPVSRETPLKCVPWCLPSLNADAHSGASCSFTNMYPSI